MEIDISKKVNYFLKFGLIGLLGLAILCSGAVWLYQHNHNYLTVADASLNSTLVGVKSRAGGKIQEIKVKDGEHVEAGQVLATIKVNVTDDQIKQLQQAVDLAKKNLNEIKAGTQVSRPVISSGGGSSVVSQAELSRAAANLERMNQLYALGAVSAMKRDQAAAAYATAQSQASSSAGSSNVSYQSSVQPNSPQVIQNAELQVKQAEAALENAKKDAAATEIVAPVAGTVYTTDVTTGSEVKAGQVLVNIGDAGNIWLEAHVNPADKGKLHLGQYVLYRIDGHDFEGSVSDISDPADTSAASSAEKSKDKNSSSSSSAGKATEGAAPEKPKTDKLTVKISVPSNPKYTLKPGQKALVKFLIK